MAGRNLVETNVSDDDEVNYDAINGTGYLSDDDRGLRIDDNIYVPPPPKISGENVDHSDARLVIKKIVNTNFKSYANQVVIGPFNERFSAIVGPNGSGKSNVIDSMLFVFGFRANRIRSKRISELIHSSNEHPNIKSCTVSVYFHKIIDRGVENDHEVVPNSDIIISKTAYKDNTSFYELNGRKVQFKEVSNLLRKEGIDLDHNRFLILQGEVEQIALMKPKALTEHDCGMLEFLEDIIGTSRYKIPLEQVASKVETLSEQVTDKLNRLRIVEHERDQLKGPMEEAVNYMRNENNIVQLKHKLLHCKKADAEENLKAEESRQQEIVDDYSKLKKKMADISKEKKAKSSEFKEKSEISAAVQEKSDTVRSQFDKIRKKDEVLHAELVETNKRRKANMASVKNEVDKLEQLKKIPEKNMKEIEECEVLVQRHTANLAKEETVLNRLMSSLREKTEPLLNKRSEFEKNLIRYRKNIDQAKATYDIAEAQLKLYTSVEKMERGKLDKFQETYRQTLKTLDDRKTQLANFETAIPTLEKSLIKNKKKLDEMKMRDAKVSAEIRQMKIHIEEKKSAMSINKSRSRVINALMQEKREERIQGIFGRLGDLGAIDIEYDVAVSTACGPLDNVVVDTVETAQQCIEFLRANNIGRATFIALEKMKRFIPYCKKKIHTPENVPRLFDLIKVEDERILPAFYYGIQDTLVADGLDQATRIAYGAKRHRVVTLKGELIETSGTMSGGGRSMIKGRMGQSVVKNDISASKIEKMEKTLEKINTGCLQLRVEQKPLEQHIEKASTELRTMTINKNKFDIEVKTLNQQLPALKSQIKNQEKKADETKANPGKVRVLEEAVATAEKGLKKAQEEAKDVQDKVNKVNEEIDVVNGDAVKQHQKKISDLTKAADKAKSEICRLQVAIKTSERNVKKVEQKMENLKSVVENCEKRLRDIQGDKQKCEVDAKNLLKILGEYEESLKKRDEMLRELKEELNSLQKREDKMKSLKIDLEQKLGEVKKSVASLEYHVEESKKKISLLKLNKIPGEVEESLENLDDDQVKALNGERLAQRLAAAKEQLSEAIPNMQVISDYMAKDKICVERLEELSGVTIDRNKIRATLCMLKKRRFDEFLAGFSVITCKLKEMYQMITLGGAADLEFVDSMDPFAEGIVFSVRPPKKSWKNISNLSGGEKTLSSLALVFALHHYKPTPLYFMDEIDAALDFKNVSIVGTYVKERTKNAQFIVVSLRSEMFELADSLIGIYKVYNATRCIPFNMINFYKQYPHLLAREKERRDKAIVNIQKKITQVSLQKSCGESQRLNLTCPPKILGNITHNNSDIILSQSKDKTKNNSLPKVRAKNRLIRRTISFSPPMKKMRRFVPRRKISTSSDNLSSSSSSTNLDDNRRDSKLCKKRKKDVIN